jgi:hypothetical protein
VGCADRADVTQYREAIEGNQRCLKQMRIYAAGDMVIDRGIPARTGSVTARAQAVRSAAATMSLASSWMRRRWSSPRKLSA